MPVLFPVLAPAPLVAVRSDAARCPGIHRATRLDLAPGTVGGCLGPQSRGDAMRKQQPATNERNVQTTHWLLELKVCK